MQEDRIMCWQRIEKSMSLFETSREDGNRHKNPLYLPSLIQTVECGSGLLVISNPVESYGVSRLSCVATWKHSWTLACKVAVPSPVSIIHFVVTVLVNHPASVPKNCWTSGVYELARTVHEWKWWGSSPPSPKKTFVFDIFTHHCYALE